MGFFDKIGVEFQKLSIKLDRQTNTRCKNNFFEFRVGLPTNGYFHQQLKIDFLYDHYYTSAILWHVMWESKR